MHAERFRGLIDATGPFVSVYFDDSHDTQDAAAQLDARLRDVRKHLEERSVEHSVIESIEAAVRSARPPVGRSGRGVIAAGATIVLDEHLIRPPTATVLRVSELPYLVPVVEHGMLHTSYLMVAVDHTGADISLHDGAARAESVQGSGHPVHKAHRAETAGYGGPQGRAEEAVRKNIREVADRLTHLADETAADIVFITGEAGARAELVAELPERVAVRAVQLQGGGRTAGTDEAEVHHEIGQEFLKRRLAAIDTAAQRFAAGHGSGLAVDGLADVTAALRDGAVDTLIIGEIGDAAVVADHDQLAVIGPDADTVSDLGGSPDRVLRADEALPLLAVATGASLVRTDERISPADGIGAVLRYPDTAAR
jgi:peptide chain release factor subunit 1